MHSFICLADKIFLSCHNLRNRNIGTVDAEHEVRPCKHCTFISLFFELRVTCRKLFFFQLGSSEACRLVALHVTILLLNSVFILISNHYILLYLSPERHIYYTTFKIVLKLGTALLDLTKGNKSKKDCQETSPRIPLPTERKTRRFSYVFYRHLELALRTQISGEGLSTSVCAFLILTLQYTSDYPC
jgi:hypothetical protein